MKTGKAEIEFDEVDDEECEFEGREDGRWQPYNCVHNLFRKDGVLCAFRRRGECTTEFYRERDCKQAQIAAEERRKLREILREMELWRPGRLPRTHLQKRKVRGRVLVV